MRTNYKFGDQQMYHGETRTREKRHSSTSAKLASLLQIIRADKILSLLLLFIILSSVLLGLSGQFIQPYKHSVTATDQLYSYRIMRNGLNYPNPDLRVYSMAPDTSIYITIHDPLHTVLDYKIYVINDTNTAYNMGPITMLGQGQISGTTNLVIPHTLYHETYVLNLSSPGLPSFTNDVTYTQTIISYPPSNYFLLIPGIILAISSIVILVSKMISISSDWDKYLLNLGAVDSKDKYGFRDHIPTYPTTPHSFQVPKLLASGILLCASGFIIFGRSYIIFTWISIILIIVGVSLILKGLLSYFSSRSI